jgi:hypothetical protein
MNDNIRIVANNLALGALAITATTSAAGGLLNASNMLLSDKASFWRSTAKTAQDITLTFTNAITFDAVALAFTSLTGTGTMQVRAYTNTADAIGSPIYNGTALVACPGGGVESWQWGKTPLGANGVPYGGGSNAVHYLPAPVTAKKIIITLVDANSVNSWIEVANVIVGKYWQPATSGDYGAPIEPLDSTKNGRDEAGNLFSDIGTRSRKQVLSLGSMSATDRSGLWKILWNNGLSVPVWFSLYPSNSDGELEQTHMFYGKMMVMGAMSSPTYRRYTNQLTLEEI